MAFESYANGWPDLKKLEELAEKVGAMPTFTSTDKAALEEFIANEQAIIQAATLATDVGELQTTVGDASSGLVKDVDDLQTTVGDNTAGLVKDVDDLQTANEYLTTEVKVGKWGTDDLYRKAYNMGATTAGTASYINSGLSNITIRKMYGITSPSTGAARPIPYYNVTGGGDTRYNVCEYNYTNNQVIFNSNFASFADGQVYVILEYTYNPPEPGPETRDDTNNEPNEREV